MLKENPDKENTAMNSITAIQGTGMINFSQGAVTKSDKSGKEAAGTGAGISCDSVELRSGTAESSCDKAREQRRNKIYGITGIIVGGTAGAAAGLGLGLMKGVVSTVVGTISGAVLGAVGGALAVGYCAAKMLPGGGDGAGLAKGFAVLALGALGGAAGAIGGSVLGGLTGAVTAPVIGTLVGGSTGIVAGALGGRLAKALVDKLCKGNQAAS